MPRNTGPRMISFWPVLVSAFMVVLIGCGGQQANSPSPKGMPLDTPASTSLPPTIAAVSGTPGATLVLKPTPTLSPIADAPPTGSPVLPSSPTPRSQPTSTPADTSKPGLSLQILSPQDGAGGEINAVRVFGLTRPDTIVAVNGIPVSISADGVFQHDLFLDEGENLIEVVATDLSGETDARYRGVFFVSPTAGIPLSIFYPADGLPVTEPALEVIGVTRQDAVVGVNGEPVAVNELGIFSSTVLLEEGPNLIEVVAVDIHQNVNFQTVVVFYES